MAEDQYGRDPGDARYWAEAQTLDDLGELTARWLQGTIRYQPAWEGTWPEPDMEPIVPVLVVANRGGFVTHFSQPGRSSAPASGRRRATVSGFGTEETILRLQNASLGTDLVVLAYPPGGKLDGLQIPISLSGGVVGIWAGAEMSSQAIQEYYGRDCHPDGVAALLGAWQATLIDPHWDRDDLLWPLLGNAVAGDQAHSASQGTP